MSESKIPTITGGAVRGVAKISRMSASRLVIGALGLALGFYGVYRLLTEIANQDLIWLAEWLIAAIILHDFILAPIIVAGGVALHRIPARARRFVQGGLITGGLITSIGVWFAINTNTGLLQYKFNRPGSVAKQNQTVKTAKALLEQNYAVNLLILLAIVAAVTLALYFRRARRDAQAADTTPSSDDPRPTDGRRDAAGRGVDQDRGAAEDQPAGLS